LWWNCSAAGQVPQTGYGGGGYRTPGFVLPNDRTDFETKNWAGYGLVRFGSRDGLGFSGNVGVRVVHLENESEGYFQQGATTFIRNGQTQTLAALAYNRRARAKFTRVLPAVNVQFSPSAEVKLRAAYTRTMDLPSFLALRASGSLGVATIPNPDSTQTNPLPPLFTNFTTDSGNPKLKPAMSDNLDFSAEWYPRQGTTAHLALFHKHITNLPIYAGTQQPVTVIFAD